MARASDQNVGILIGFVLHCFPCFICRSIKEIKKAIDVMTAESQPLSLYIKNLYGKRVCGDIKLYERMLHKQDVTLVNKECSSWYNRLGDF